MRRLALILLLLPGCYLFKHNPTMPRQTEAMGVVRNAYRPLLGPKVDTYKFRLEWSKRICPYPASDGQMKTACMNEHKCHSGLTWIGTSCVAWRGSFSASAFAHELLHQFLNATGHGTWLIDLPDGDPRLCVECRAAEQQANQWLRASGL